MSGSELVASWKVSDATSSIEFANANSTNAVFAPWFRARNLDNSTDPALYFYGYIGDALDTGTQAVLRFDARKQDNTAITTRPLFSFRNAGTEIFAMFTNEFRFADKALTNIGNVTLNDARNIAVSTTTGTKIGTSVTQKLGFYNATPIVQPAANADTSGATLEQLETEVNELKQILRNLGFMASA